MVKYSFVKGTPITRFNNMCTAVSGNNVNITRPEQHYVSCVQYIVT